MQHRLCDSRSGGTALPKAILVYFALFLCALAGLTAWSYHLQHHAVQRDVQTNLETVAQSKADQVIQWRNERIADALQLVESPFLAKAIADWLEKPTPDMTADLLVRFSAAAKYSHYSDVILTDTRGNILLSLSGAHGPFQSGTARALAESLRERKPLLSELQSGTGDLPPHLDVIAPMTLTDANPQRLLGAIILRCDVSKSLYPLIQTWPAPSRSAEAVLVRRDGQSVLFLNPTRFQPESALKLRVHLTRTNLPVVRAVLGQEGVYEGSDYRGVKVVSVAKAVPGTPWFIVAKMDASEASLSDLV